MGEIITSIANTYIYTDRGIPSKYMTTSDKEWARLIQEHGTPEEQLPHPNDGEIKVLSTAMRDFVVQHSEFTLREESFSYFGQIETDYFTTEKAVDEFSHPQAEIKRRNGEPKVVTHYTTSVA